VPWIICRCKLEASTTSKSTMTDRAHTGSGKIKSERRT
jgi:hypothetical protein